VGNTIPTTSQRKDKGQPPFIQEQNDTSWKCWVSQDPTTPLPAKTTAKPKTFKQYLQTIPQWERELLADSECMDGTDGASLAALLKDYKQGNNLVGASDGGLRKIKREYGVQGWVIAIFDSHIIWKGKEQLQAHQRIIPN
jgi:hypothetical protein